MKNPTSRWWVLVRSALATGGFALAGLGGAGLVLVGCGADPAGAPDTTATTGGGSAPSGPTSGGDGGGGSDGGACAPGETRFCEIPVGTQDGILTCVAGQEDCRSDGAWGPCEGAIFARSAEGLPDGLRGDELRDPVVIERWLASREAAGGRPLRRALPGGDSAGDAPFPGDDGAVQRAQTDSESCDSPCDPDCQAFPNPVDPTEPDSDIADSSNGATLLEFIEAVAGGLLDKLFPTEDCTSASDCNVDTYCADEPDEDDPTDGCEDWDDGEYDPAAGGVDFTVGAGCGNVGAQVVPVCNRGDVAYTGDLTAWIWPANAPEISTCTIPSNKSPQKACTFAADLSPGECMVMPATCWSGVTGNNKAVMINPSRAATNTVTPLPEAAGKTCNNWGFWDKSANCASCTDSWEAELDQDDDDGSFCGVYFDMDVDILSDERMIDLEYRSDDGEAWEPVTWVWNDRWDHENSWEEDGCSGGAQAFIYQHTQLGDLHYHVRLCDDLCDRAGDDADPAVRFTYDCPREFDDELVGSVVYQGVCPPAKRVQWGYLGFNGVTPGNSRIDFDVRTGSTDPPTDGDWIDLVRAKDDAGGDDVPPACLLTDPDDECPIDLFTALDGAPDATQEFLEVRYTLTSSSDNAVAPRLYELYATFTCPDSE
jgi:hypothetical protein